MPKLIIIRDQVAATGDDIIMLDSGITPTDALMANFPDGLTPDSVRIYVDNE